MRRKQTTGRDSWGIKIMRIIVCFAKTKTIFKEIKAKLENIDTELETMKYSRFQKKPNWNSRTKNASKQN